MMAAGLVAHGGTGGLVVEGALVLGFLVIVFAVWRSERRVRRKDENENRTHFEDR
jgi:hypothetical protein